MSSPRAPHFHFKLSESPYGNSAVTGAQSTLCCVCGLKTRIMRSFDVDYTSRSELTDASPHTQSSLKQIVATLHVYLCSTHAALAQDYKPKGYDYRSSTSSLIRHIKRLESK